jgi:Ser/Thr protein kinase RdoA (MazF antagonist)
VVQTFADEFASNTWIAEDTDGTPTECSLFLWAEGKPLAADLTPENYFELGRMSAELHRFASNWVQPPGLKPLMWNRTMYYEGSSLVIADPRYSELISREDARAVEAVVKEADEELARLGTGSDRIFLHGNIEMWNVLVTAPGELRLIDFEDVMFGHPVQDVAITLYYGSERPDYADLSYAYQRGYRSVRDWPVMDNRQVELLVASRAAMLLNHALQTESDRKSVINRLLPLILAMGR